MKYAINQKIGSITAIFTVIHNRRRTDECVMVIDHSIERLRTRLSKYMKIALRKIKPDGDMIQWHTKLGTFCIYRGFEYDNNEQPCKSKYKQLYQYVELDSRKQGLEVETRKYFIKKIVNDECEDLEECFVCNAKMAESFKIKQWGEMVSVCKKCKDFDTKLNKISKELDKKSSEDAKT